MAEGSGTDAGARADRHILMVESEDMYARQAGSMPAGTSGRYRITLARSVKEGRKVIADDPPALIIADWLLPDGRGIDLLPLRDGRVTTPLIIMTRNPDARLAVRLMKSGAIDYIVKADLHARDLTEI